MQRKLNKPQMRSDYPKAAQAAPKKRKGFSINVLTYKGAYASIKAWYKNKRKGLTMTNNTNTTPKTTKTKKPASATKIAVIAILGTLVVLGAFAATFYAGVRYHANYQEKVELRASQIVTQLK